MATLTQKSPRTERVESRDPFVSGLRISMERQRIVADYEYRHGSFVRGMCWIAARLLSLAACLGMGATIYWQVTHTDHSYTTSSIYGGTCVVLGGLAVWAHLACERRVAR